MTPLEILRVTVGATPSDAELRAYISRAEAQIEAYIDQPLYETLFTDELYEIPTSNYLYLKQWPIKDLTAVKLAGAVIPINQFRLNKETGKLNFIDATSKASIFFASGVYELTYQAGYAPDPNQPTWLSEVIASVAARIMASNNGNLDPSVSQESISGIYSVTYGDEQRNTASEYPFLSASDLRILDAKRGRGTL